jgi:hypothetical protein
MRDTILMGVIIVAMCYAIMYSIARGADIAHCQHYGLDHSRTDYRLRGFCEIQPRIEVAAEIIGREL